MEIIPAIMPKDVKDLKKKVSLVSSYVDTVQLDLMDGEFVPDTTWPFDVAPAAAEALADRQSKPSLDELKELKKIQKDFSAKGGPAFGWELDLMVKNAGEHIEQLVESKAKRLIFHIEAEDSLAELFDNIETMAKSKTEIGVAINTTTDIEEIFPWIPKIDFVQLMGIEEIGFQGQPFDEKVLEQIAVLREEYPNVTISVDGGVNMETAPQLIEAGANRLVIGSAIFESKDIKKTIKEFKNLA